MHDAKDRQVGFNPGSLLERKWKYYEWADEVRLRLLDAEYDLDDVHLVIALDHRDAVGRRDVQPTQLHAVPAATMTA